MACLAHDTRAEDVVHTLERYGKLARTNDNLLRSRGLFFATFCDQRDADAAMRALNGSPAFSGNGDTLVVQYAKPNRDGGDTWDARASLFVSLSGGRGRVPAAAVRTHFEEHWRVPVLTVSPRGVYSFLVECCNVKDAERLLRDKHETLWPDDASGATRVCLRRYEPPDRARTRSRSRSPSPRKSRRSRSPSPVKVVVRERSPQPPALDPPLSQGQTAVVHQLAALIKMQQQLLEAQQRQQQQQQPFDVLRRLFSDNNWRF
jgi:hypothetical protein